MLGNHKPPHRRGRYQELNSRNRSEEDLAIRQPKEVPAYCEHYWNTSKPPPPLVHKEDKKELSRS